MAAEQQPDALQTILSAVQANPSDPLSAFTFLDASGSAVDGVVQAQTVRITTPSAAEPVTLDKAQPTRLARSKETLASRLSSGSPPSPEAEADLFFTVEALILALKLREERAGAYLAQAASARVAAIPALDRNGILEFLLGKRAEWAGVLPLGGASGEGVAGAAGAEGDAATASGQAPGQAASGVKRAYVPNRADIEFVKRLRSTYEVVLRTRNDALRGSSASLNGGAAVSRIGSSKVTDFSTFRKAFSAKLDAARKAGGSGAARGGASSSRLPVSSSSSAPGGQARRQRAQDPIIVISNSPTSLLNMFNIKQYLEEGIFVPPEEARTRARGVADLVVSITSRGGVPNAGGAATGTGIGRRILVVDNAEAVNRLGGSSAGPGQDPWNRVVAVFTTGQAWQFKTYKWNEPRELFKNVMGVYVRWHNEPQNPNVREWNVTELQVDRTKRHTDKQVVAFFWRSLETWTQRRKPHLIT